MTILYWLNEIETSHRPLVGDKAFLLSQLQRQGYPIFSGFVLTSRTFREFLDLVGNTSSLLADFPSSSLHLDVDNPKSLQLVAKQSRSAILEIPFPSQWQDQLLAALQRFDVSTLIVRPSLLVSLPQARDLSGILPAQITINELDAVEKAIKQGWSSLFSAKSLFFWQKIGVKLENLPVGLLVQPIRNAIASGVGYFENNDLTLQATWGLGYSLLQGNVEPDYYQLDLSQNTIKSRQLGQKACGYRLKSFTNSQQFESDALECYLLNSQQQNAWVLDEIYLQQFLELGQQLQSHYPNPKRIEWTIPEQIEDNRLIYLNQLTLLPNNDSDSLVSQISLTEPFQETQLTGICASPGRAIAPLYLISEESESPVIPPHHILVAKTLPSRWLPWLKTAKGIILEEGGITSHGAILARELGIPALVGVKMAMQRLKSGESMIIDGNQGKICPPSEDLSLLVEESLSRPQITYEPIATSLMVNLSQGDLLNEIADLPVDGVGLIRSELMLLELLQQKPLDQWLEPSQQALLEEHLVGLIGRFAEVFQPRPVFYRSFDGSIPETSTYHRGTSAYLADSRFFKLELRVLRQLQQQGYHHLHLLLPFVRHEAEFHFCQQLVQQVGLDRFSSFQLWIMAEVPSVLFLLEEYVKAGVQGIAIGTNDLAQLLLGIDRETSWQSDYQALHHPALLKALEQLIKQAKRLKISTCLCGQLPVNAPDLIEQLIRWGIDAISVEPASVHSVYQAIARAEQKILLDLVRDKASLIREISDGKQDDTEDH